jgi:hypothetical protein
MSFLFLDGWMAWVIKRAEQRGCCMYVCYVTFTEEDSREEEDGKHIHGGAFIFCNYYHLPTYLPHFTTTTHF